MYKIYQKMISPTGIRKHGHHRIITAAHGVSIETTAETFSVTILDHGLEMTHEDAQKLAQLIMVRLKLAEKGV